MIFFSLENVYLNHLFESLKISVSLWLKTLYRFSDIKICYTKTKSVVNIPNCRYELIIDTVNVKKKSQRRIINGWKRLQQTDKNKTKQLIKWDDDRHENQNESAIERQKRERKISRWHTTRSRLPRSKQNKTKRYCVFFFFLSLFSLV